MFKEEALVTEVADAAGVVHIALRLPMCGSGDFPVMSKSSDVFQS